MAHEIQFQESGIHIYFTGNVSFKEIREVDTGLDGSEELYSSKVRYILYDFTNSIFEEMSELEVKLSAGYDKGTSFTKSELKIAIAGREETLKDCIKDYKKFAKMLDLDWDIMLFDTFEEAFT